MADFDYRLRPSKAVQRYMIIDVCRKLSAFAPLSDYQYVGFGGLEFVDFDLLHRSLGVNKMTSIESDTYHLDRYLFNTPFNGITVLPGWASAYLPSIDWSMLSIVWLDYEKALVEDVISDVLVVCGRIQPGSALFVTVNATPERRIAGRRDGLAERIGEERIPGKVTDESLGNWGLAEIQHQVLTDIMIQALRNRQVPAEWRQVLSINYADDARMQTMGGIITAPGLRQTFESADFGDLDFVRTAGQEPVMIRVPVLTSKERRALDEQFPAKNLDAITVPVPREDAESYMKVYRYCGNSPHIFA